MSRLLIDHDIATKHKWANMMLERPIRFRTKLYGIRGVAYTETQLWYALMGLVDRTYEMATDTIQANGELHDLGNHVTQMDVALLKLSAFHLRTMLSGATRDSIAFQIVDDCN